ncbi:hypothetical protein Tco_0588212 [Tanacetum coccineum]
MSVSIDLKLADIESVLLMSSEEHLMKQKLDLSGLSNEAYLVDKSRSTRILWLAFNLLVVSYALSWKPCQGDSLNLPDHRIHKDGDASRFKNHESSRIKDKDFRTNSDIKDNSLEIKLRGRLLASFQDDAKYEHVGQDTRSQGGKDDQDKQGKDLKISDIKTKSKDNDKGSRSKITKHEGTSLQRIQRPRPQDLNDKSNLIDLMKECHNELTSGEIVSLKILSRTMEVRSLY